MENANLTSPLYAVIDLGSNSFHMLITRQLAESVQIVDKVKRKVRLASGLNKDNLLSEDAIARGLECLSFFAERLQDIPSQNVKIVATATLRLATNSDDFLSQANKILHRDVQLLSGIEEAEYIYQGVAHTSCGSSKRLVLDIGGASTEIIVGEGVKSKQVVSLDIGCVTFMKSYFAQGAISNEGFELAIASAANEIKPHVEVYQKQGWDIALGGSGTMQALAEVLLHNQHPPVITKSFLKEFRAQLTNFDHVSAIQIPGLLKERTPVITSGVAILTALFEQLNITSVQLSSGALREGLLYEMLPADTTIDIRQKTINSLMARFHVDRVHANSVLCQANVLFDSLTINWSLERSNNFSILQAACQLHEVGLLLDFKHHQKHSAYIIENNQLPGFDVADKQLLSTLVKLYKADIDIELLNKQAACKVQQAGYLLAILRLAVILCRRRTDDVLPSYQCSANKNHITLTLPADWLQHHPLIADELMQENLYLKEIGLSLETRS